jgi:hypothetical protein
VARLHGGYHYHGAGRRGLTPIAAIKYLKTVRPLASNHCLGVAITELDLTHRSASGVKLAENNRRAVPGTSRRPTW